MYNFVMSDPINDTQKNNDGKLLPSTPLIALTFDFTLTHKQKLNSLQITTIHTVSYRTNTNRFDSFLSNKPFLYQTNSRNLRVRTVLSLYRYGDQQSFLHNLPHPNTTLTVRAHTTIPNNKINGSFMFFSAIFQSCCTVERFQ